VRAMSQPPQGPPQGWDPSQPAWGPPPRMWNGQPLANEPPGQAMPAGGDPSHPVYIAFAPPKEPLWRRVKRIVFVSLLVLIGLYVGLIVLARSF